MYKRPRRVSQALRRLTTNKTILRFGLGGFSPILKLVPILVSTEPQVSPAQGRRPLLLVGLSFKVVDQRLIRSHWARIHHADDSSDYSPHRTTRRGSVPGGGPNAEKEKTGHNR
jgi:hypothetical protein